MRSVLQRWDHAGWLQKRLGEPCAECGHIDWRADFEDAGLLDAEAAFLNASIAVWQEIDRLSVEPGGYKGLPQSTELRQHEREAWEGYRAALIATGRLTESGGER